MNLELFIDIVRLALKSLTERKLRALLTIIGIAIGPLALVMMSSVVEGYSRHIISQIEALGQNLILVRPREHFELRYEDLQTIRSIQGVEAAYPLYITTAIVRVGTETKKVTVYATNIDAIFSAIGGLELIDGTVPLSTEVTKCVVGYDIAFKDGLQVHRVGDVITLTLYIVEEGGRIKERRISVLIEGILGKFGGAFLLSPDDSIFLPTAAGRRLLGMNRWSGILVLAKSSSVVDSVVKRIRSRYGDVVDIISFQGIARMISSVTGAMKFITFSTSLSAFAVAVAGVAATMITSIIERTREIGVLKAMGFTDLQILFLILAESLIMSLIGGAIGIALGIVGAYLLASKGFVIHGISSPIVIRAEPAITFKLILQTIAITLLVGVLGGVFPARKAAKIPPAAALRYE
ncbi:MAG TPA: FtsX-like permease family protein [Ignisphaera sp.]|uniref:FtsX-like permease family protein n=1 Tax=Ignisphaera aggregans TaxID=334771 RepID=A0A832YT94_9CREN|nr:FtsX-like permease family protein [Ignisphaera sp.]HIP57360.1 FtsX-like permease family protein [Ignisphaera aggregans]